MPWCVRRRSDRVFGRRGFAEAARNADPNADADRPALPNAFGAQVYDWRNCIENFAAKSCRSSRTNPQDPYDPPDPRLAGKVFMILRHDLIARCEQSASVIESALKAVTAPTAAPQSDQSGNSIAPALLP